MRWRMETGMGVIAPLWHTTTFPASYIIYGSALMGARGRPRRTESGEVEIGGCHRDQVPSDAEPVQSAPPPCSILRQTLLPHAGSAPDTSRRHFRIPRRRLRENEPA